MYTFTATPIYEARTRLLIESDDPNIVSFKEVIDKGPAESDYYQTQYNILQSRTLARDTLDELHLWNSPLFGAPPAGRSVAVASARGPSAPVRPRHGSEDSRSADEIGAQSRAVDRFLENLTISPVRNSRLVDVRYRLPDPAVAAAVANGVAKNYIEQNLAYKFTASRDASDWLGERLTEQRAQVEKAELALQQYREQNEAISLEDRQNIVVQKLADLNAAVTKAKTERLQKEAMYRQLSAAGQDAAMLDTFPAILGNAFIQTQKTELAALQRQQAQLAERLGDRHPEMVKVKSAIQNAEAELRAEVAKVVQAVRTEYQAALAQEQSLTTALDQQKREALAMNRKGIEYSVLEREVESGRQIYQSLMQRAKETSVTGELKSSNVRVVDRAEVPRQPVAPRAVLSLVLALFGGTLPGVRSRVLLRVPRQPHQDAGGDRSAPRPPDDRTDPGARKELAPGGTPPQQRRPAGFCRGIQGASHQRPLLSRRERVSRRRRHQHRTRRGQDDRREQSRDRRSRMPVSACC